MFQPTFKDKVGTFFGPQGGWMETAMMMDMFAPDNPFKGGATQWGQSMKANEAMQKRQAAQSQWQSMIGNLLSGQNRFTPMGTEGFTDMKMTAGAPGSDTDKITLNMDAARRPEPTGPQHMSFSDLMGP